MAHFHGRWCVHSVERKIINTVSILSIVHDRQFFRYELQNFHSCEQSISVIEPLTEYNSHRKQCYKTCVSPNQNYDTIKNLKQHQIPYRWYLPIRRPPGSIVRELAPNRLRVNAERAPRREGGVKGYLSKHRSAWNLPIVGMQVRVSPPRPLIPPIILPFPVLSRARGGKVAWIACNSRIKYKVSRTLKSITHRAVSG